MNVKKFIELLEGAVISSSSESWYFITSDVAYATNNDGAISKMVAYPTDKIFGDIISTPICFGFHDLKSTIKKLKTLGDEAKINFGFAGEYNDYKVVSQTKLERTSPLLKFPILHPSANYVLGNTQRNPNDEKFSVVGERIVISDTYALKQGLSIMEEKTMEGHMVAVTIKYVEGGIEVSGDSVTFIVEADCNSFEQFNLTKKDFSLSLTSDSPTTIVVGSNEINLCQDTAIFHIPMKGNESDAVVTSTLDDDFFTADFDY